MALEVLGSRKRKRATRRRAAHRVREGTAPFCVSLYLVVLVDAAVSGSVPPGTVRCHRVTDLAEVATFGSHGMDVATVIRLGQALGRAPGEIVIVSVEAGDTGQGSRPFGIPGTQCPADGGGDPGADARSRRACVVRASL